MKHNYISVPRIWVSEDNIKLFNVSNERIYSDNSKIVLLNLRNL